MKRLIDALCVTHLFWSSSVTARLFGGKKLKSSMGKARENKKGKEKQLEKKKNNHFLCYFIVLSKKLSYLYLLILY